MIVAERTLQRELLERSFDRRIRWDVPLAPYTSARIGGPADGLLTPASRDELAEVVTILRQLEVPFRVIGGGSNILVSDLGVAGVVVLNRARRISFVKDDELPEVWAESGASLGVVARQAASRNLGGLAWAAGIPGTVGGAVVGNAGAHGSEISQVLSLAEILHPDGEREECGPERLGFTYRSSAFKGHPGGLLILSTRFKLQPLPEAEIRKQMDEFIAYRRRTQPPGASMGSMFKNPPGDFAGRLIETAGLKGYQIGGAQISPLHANFFLNHGGATGRDVLELIRLAARTVAERFGVELETEVELIGEWPEDGIS
jgi:UDP-N-acetylmuramate dehydrogenase